MGVLDIRCLATDPDATTFYGFAYATTYNGYSNIANNPFHVILVKSNPNPVSPDNLTWSLVSELASWKLIWEYEPSAGVEYSCAVNAQGVFTVFSRYKGIFSKKESVPHGIRYDPAGTMDPRFRFEGPGAWMNITIDNAYSWTGDFKQHISGYINSRGTSLLVHAFLSEKSNTVHIASVNEATKTLTAAGVWDLSYDTYGVLNALTIGNNHLYTFGPANALVYRDPVLTGFPLSPISPITPVGKSFNTSQTHNCYFSTGEFLYMNRSSLTLVCSHSSVIEDPSSIYTIADPNTATGTGPPENFTLSILFLDYFVSIGGGPGQGSFALYQTKYSYQDYQIYAFGKEGGQRYMKQIPKVNVTDPMAIKGPPPPDWEDS
ncbi:hypothetical protein BGX33_008955, partial [Mortierella sp. NVP41]